VSAALCGGIHGSRRLARSHLTSTGGRRAGRIEAYGEVMVGLVNETPDMGPAELRKKLKEREVSGIGAL
jgi:hypothetical protein